MHIGGAATRVRGSERWRGVESGVRLETEQLEFLHQGSPASLMVVV